jgi:hypothetical protein
MGFSASKAARSRRFSVQLVDPLQDVELTFSSGNNVGLPKTIMGPQAASNSATCCVPKDVGGRCVITAIKLDIHASIWMQVNALGFQV